MQKFVPVALVLALGCCFAEEGGETDQNPEYTMWSSFKVGSWSKYSLKMEADGKSQEMTITVKLLEVTPEKVVVETEMVSMEGGKEEKMNNKEEYLAKADPAKHPLDRKPDGEEGEETIKVGEEEYECEWFETAKAEMGAKGKTWICEDVPGGLVKAETAMEGPGGKGKVMTMLLECEAVEE